jgi:methylmalonyl-CoA mutase
VIADASAAYNAVMSDIVRIAQDFPPFGEADWQRAVARARRLPPGTAAPESGALPLFPAARSARPIVAHGGAPWRLVQRIDADSIESVIAALADDIAGGATGAEIVCAGSVHPAPGRLPAAALTALAASLPPLPASFELRIDADGAVPDVLLDRAASAATRIVVARDPVAAHASGRPSPDATALRHQAAELERRAIAGSAAVADGRLWHAAGATDEQELAVVLASYVELLRMLDATGRVSVTLVADADQFRTIAKFRAMRLLLARIAELAMLNDEAPFIHAETAWRMMTTLSPETNVVRTTIAAFGAAAGGADSIAVLPFDIAAGRGDAHARRLARNTQLILADEAGLSTVADPGAGAGAIETMTTRLAESAWRRFQAIEKLGGVVAAIGEGSLLREIAAARLARAAGIANGETRMVGVNVYREDGNAAPAAHAALPDRSPRLVPVRMAAAFE